jgi:uncharacterized protein YceK
MKKIAVVIVAAILLSGCYSVSQVGNCKYYTPKYKSSHHKVNKPIGF